MGSRSDLWYTLFYYFVESVAENGIMNYAVNEVGFGRVMIERVIRGVDSR